MNDPSEKDLEEWLNRLYWTWCKYTPSKIQKRYEVQEGCRRAVNALRRLIEERGEMKKRPKIICFCGSSRFIDHFGIWQWTAEREGHIALGLHWLPPTYRDELGRKAEDDHQAEAEGISKKMDELHLRKIDLADEVFILNVGGYIGESTRNELNYAKRKGKLIRFLEPPKEAPDD